MLLISVVYFYSKKIHSFLSVAELLTHSPYLSWDNLPRPTCEAKNFTSIEAKFRFAEISLDGAVKFAQAKLGQNENSLVMEAKTDDFDVRL